jgi:hypothetical protein
LRFQKLGKEIEEPAIKWARKAKTVGASSTVIKTDPDGLKSFVASVFWRAGKANQGSFKNYMLSAEQSAVLLKLMLRDRTELSLFDLRVARLVDNRNPNAPLNEIILLAEPNVSDGVTCIMVVGGLMWELCFPAPKKGSKWADEFMGTGIRALTIPTHDYLQDTRLHALGHIAKEKRAIGAYTNAYAKKRLVE